MVWLPIFLLQIAKPACNTFKKPNHVCARHGNSQGLAFQACNFKVARLCMQHMHNNCTDKRDTYQHINNEEHVLILSWPTLTRQAKCHQTLDFKSRTTGSIRLLPTATVKCHWIINENCDQLLPWKCTKEGQTRNSQDFVPRTVVNFEVGEPAA